jgi:lysophospholipase L1-like esterase
VLVIFSDRVEESEHYNFTRENLTEARIKKIISQNRSRGLLPDLAGVKVYVVGASAGAYEKMRSGRMAAIRDFWLAYFKACGAELTRERYGGALLGWRELKS